VTCRFEYFIILSNLHLHVNSFFVLFFFFIAFKRKFDQLDYYELSETINLFDQRQNVSENVMYDLLCQEIHLFLTPEEVRLFEALKRGEKIDRNQKYRIKKKIMDYIKRYW
jgi:competence protein ComX